VKNPKRLSLTIFLACCEEVTPFEQGGKYLDEAICFEEGPALGISITQNFNKQCVTFYDETLP
jgi:hypothetical protein